MQTIELKANQQANNGLNQFQMQQAEHSLECTHELDDALATLVKAVRSTNKESDMDALGVMLSYMEMLEKNQAKKKASTDHIWLHEPVTLTL